MSQGSQGQAHLKSVKKILQVLQLIQALGREHAVLIQDVVRKEVDIGELGN